MARRFARVDLSNRARDFRPVAIEPGVPLLDTSNTNSRILFKWLGGLAAEPEWEGESVNFYVRDDHGGRLEDVSCQPAADVDLQGPLKDGLEALKERIASAAPETATERAVHKILTQTFSQLIEDETRSDRDNYFFRYRDAVGRWRLVWCWGYQRVDQEPAASVICSDPDCCLLFVRRPGQSGKCPRCEALAQSQPARPVERTSWTKVLLVALLFLLLGGGLVYWHLGRDQLIVAPEQLELIVGQIADLSVRSRSSDPVRMTSSDPAVVGLTSENRLVARSQGTARVEVSQALKRRTVDVTVTEAKVISIALEPARIVVPVDHSVPVRVMGQVEGGRTVELAPEQVSAEKRPSPWYADFYPASLEVHGVWPTEATSPQSLALRYQDHRAEAAVEVVVAPFRLELTPKGPVDLPVGQTTSLAAWANYQDGDRVEVPADRIQWQTAAGASTETAGLELRAGKVAALKPGAGPLEVWGTYFERKSNRVSLRSVEAGPITLQADVDRTLRLAGEPGRVMLLGTGPQGDVELVLDLAHFTSSDERVLKIDQTSGAFRAVAPGEAVVKASHAAAAEPVSVHFRVVDPADARLAFQPDSVRVAVDEVARLELFLEAGQGDQVERAAMAGPEVRYWIAEPDAVTWRAPLLVGKRPAAPFQIGASYLPYLPSQKGPATAQLEVVAAVSPRALRVVPSNVRMAPGQSLALAVEEQLAGSEQWTEVCPDTVAWQVPPGVGFSPATETLRAAIKLPEGAVSPLTLTAEHRGKRAKATIDVGGPQLDPADPAVRLVLEREPEGRYLPVGSQQRYSIRLEKGGVTEPAADIHWPVDFENDYLRWRAPVLTAKQGGFGQWLQAEVGGRAVRFYTHTVDPFLSLPKPTEEPPPRDDLPVEVVIRSDQGPAVRFPVGVEFDDFRVEASYADGFTRIVTKEAALRTPEEPPPSPVTFSGGRMIGVHPGQTRVEASFDGVKAKEPLAVEVTAELDVDEIRLRPATVNVLPGETVGMDAVGYHGGRPVGVLSDLPGLKWQSENDQVVAVNGPTVTGKRLGQAGVSAQLGSVTSQPAVVSVVESIPSALVVDRELIRMRVGESRHVGTDIQVFRGQTDLSDQATVTSSLADVVEYVPETRSLRGVRPGAAAVTFGWGNKLATTMVEVTPDGDGGTAGSDRIHAVNSPMNRATTNAVVVEPAAGTLAPGQAIPLRVYLVSREGSRIDRTDSAVFTSASPATIAIRGNRACALAPGSAEISAQLPEASSQEEPGRAYLTVNDEQLTDLIVEPSQVRMSVGDSTGLRILGTAAGGTRELFPQPQLAVKVGGPSPQAVRVVGSGQVDAVAPGEAELAVTWADRLSRKVPVTVTDDPWAELAIDPAGATIHSGQTLVYRVTGVRGGRRRVLTAADGLEMFVGQPTVAQLAAGTAVVGASPGRTNVVAQMGRQQAEAALTVASGDGPGGSVVHGPGGTVISRPGGTYAYGPGYGHYGPGYGVIYGPGGGVVHAPDGTVVTTPGPAAVYAPPAASVSGLRFIPDVLRVPTDSAGAPVQVVEVLADGSLGRNIAGDPKLEFTTPPSVARVEKTAGGAIVRPVSPGETRLAAKLGTLVTETPLLVQVGQEAASAARLDVRPPVLDLWAGEVGTFRGVAVSAGAGQSPHPIDYRIAVASGSHEGVVAVEGDRTVRGVADGIAPVVVTAVDPTGPYDGLSRTATVRVSAADRLWIEPSAVSLRTGKSTPPFTVMAQGKDGPAYQVPAVLESSDPSILAPDAHAPGVFVATGLGATQVRAVYRNREALAEVTVTGQRFADVETTLDEGERDFGVTAEVLAAASEGPLEYRIYASGGEPPKTWVPSEPFGEYRRAVLRSPQMPYGPRTARYNLVLEARSPADGSVQRYPFTFRLAPNIERTD